MQKTKHWLMTIAALLCSLAASAHDFEVGGIYYNITSSSDLTVAVTYRGSSYSSYYQEYSGVVSIPSTVTYNGNAYSVTSIGNYAFWNCNTLTSITIPASVTSIGGYAFFHCSKLTSITLPESVTSINVYAFKSCTSLTSINIPEGVTSIKEGTFCNCSSLTSINIPESVTSIKYEAFYLCSSLTSFVSFPSIAPEIIETFEGINADATLTIPYGSTSSYEEAGWLSHFASVVEMPGGNDGNITWMLTSDGELIIEGTGAMSNYTYNNLPWYEHRSSITKVTIKEGVTSIGQIAFSGCSSLTSITIPEGVTRIGSYAFSSCSSLTTVVLPESVMSIGGQAFSGCGITSINIPEGVTYIEDMAFYGCSSLTDITIPENSQLTSIYEAAFGGCSNLTAVYIGDISVWCKIKFFNNGSNPLYYAKNLYLNGELVTELTLPEDVTSIGNYAFYNYQNLTTITLPEGVTSIGQYAFYNCNSLTSINIPEGVRSIGNYAFYDCSSLTAITLPESVTSINDFAFRNCSSLTTINIPEGVTGIGKQAFYGCSSLTSITLPESVTSIGLYAFQNCSSLTTVNIPEGVTYINDYAFRNCSSLTAITLPEGVTSIGTYAFSGCSSLTSFVSFPSIAPDINATGVFEGIPADATLTIPYGSTSSYEEAGWFSHFASVVEIISGNDGNITWELTSDGELIIEGTGAMNNYSSPAYAPWWYEHRSSITKVTIEEGVTSIGNFAFYGCSNLTTITIPESVTSIGSGAFSVCSSLAAITIPEGVTSIGSSAFSGCSSLTAVRISSIEAWCNISFSGSYSNPFMYAKYLYLNGVLVTDLTIPDGVTSIKDYAFYKFISLVSITLPESVTSIGNYAFYNCSSLTSITIPEGVTSIGDNAFYNCSSLTSITIPEDVTSIGSSVFYGCSSLTAVRISSIEAWCNISFSGSKSNPLYYAKNLYLNGELVTDLTIPDGVTSIKDYAFYEFISLASITLPESVTSIGRNAFWYCSSLAAINIPEGVTSIGNEAFYKCSSLTSITIPEGVTSIGSSAFSGCSNLTSITILEGVTSIGDYAFSNCSSLTSITFPESVTNIGDYAFRNCSSLTDVYCYAEEDPGAYASAFYNSNIGNATLHVPANALKAYQTTAPWRKFGNIQAIPEAITINQYGSGTYCSEYALDFSEVKGLKAYAATGYKTSTGIVTLTRVMTSQPGMGLFLKGEPGEYSVPILESTDENSLNMLVGTLESTPVNGISDDGLYYNYRYTIHDGDAEPMFYRVDDGYKLGAGKAYLQIPVAWMPAEAKAIAMRFDDGGTTDIEDIESGIQHSELIYDLMGRKVTHPQKGVVYIVNGKKVVIK